MRRPLTAAAAAAVCLCGPAGAERAVAISADERIGSYRVKTDGSLGGAVRAFGRPVSLRRTSAASCTAAWRRPSVTIFFYNLGGADPCSPRGGRFLRAIARGPGWRTGKGLRTGDSVLRLRALYPRARFRRGLRHYWPAGYWLSPRRNLFGLPGSYPGLLAETRGGRVVGFHVRFQGGGE